MKTLKRCACALIILSVLIPSLALAADEPKLCFDSGGFKLLIAADVQDWQWTSPYFIEAFSAVLDAEQPDLVVLLGDQLEGWRPEMRIGGGENNAETAIANILAPLVERGIPFAPVLGNHDAECGVSRERNMEIYMSYPGCLAVDDGELPGAGTYNVLIYDKDGVTPLINLYFVDSLDYAESGGYASVSTEQIEWCGNTAATLCEEYGETLPAMLFQHIIVPEVFDALIPADEDDDGAVERTLEGEDRCFLLESDSLISGEINENPCSPEYSSGQFDSWIKQGDVFAAFFGHDHMNSFVIENDGIDLVACPASTFLDYASEATRGVRIVELHEDDVTAYDTRIVLYRDYLEIRGLDAVRYHLLATDNVFAAYKHGAILIVVLIAAIALIITALARRRRRRRSKA